MSFRDDVIACLEDELDAEAVAGQLRQVIRGESVVEEYKFDKSGEAQLVKRKVTRTARDVAAGLVVADYLRGGEMGLAPRQLDTGSASKEMYQKYQPVIDARIIHVPDDD